MTWPPHGGAVELKSLLRPTYAFIHMSPLGFQETRPRDLLFVADLFSAAALKRGLEYSKISKSPVSKASESKIQPSQYCTVSRRPKFCAPNLQAAPWVGFVSEASLC